MKNKISRLFLLGITIATLTSCAASRSRTGCPMNVQAAPAKATVAFTK